MAGTGPATVTDDCETPDHPLDEVTATYVPRTELGRRLLTLRAEIVRSGLSLLSRDEVEREVAERRGGVALREFEEQHGE